MKFATGWIRHRRVLTKHAVASVLLALLVPSAICVAVAQERLWLKYMEVADLFEKFQSIPEARRAGLAFRVRLLPLDGAALEGVSLELRSASRGVLQVPVSADGSFTLPTAREFRTEDPPLWIRTPPKVKVALGPEVLITIPGREVRYNDMAELVDRAGEGLRKHAGIWSLFMPKPEGLELWFSPKENAAVKALSGNVWTADARGVVVVPLSSDLRSSNPVLSLPGTPALARPHFKRTIRLIPDGEVPGK
jgi:hypothetical protein